MLLLRVDEPGKVPGLLPTALTLTSAGSRVLPFAKRDLHSPPYHLPPRTHSMQLKQLIK